MKRIAKQEHEKKSVPVVLVARKSRRQTRCWPGKAAATSEEEKRARHKHDILMELIQRRTKDDVPSLLTLHSTAGFKEGRRTYQEQAEMVINHFIKGKRKVTWRVILSSTSFAFSLDSAKERIRNEGSKQEMNILAQNFWRSWSEGRGSYLYSKSCSPDDTTLAKGAFHSTAHVKVVDVEAVGRY